MNKENKKIAVYTLGCRANQADSDEICSLLALKGFTIVNPKELADIYIINTCSVTSKAAYQSRQIIRRFIKKNKQASIYVTGCDVEFEREILESIKGVDQIFGVKNKEDLINAIGSRKSSKNKTIFQSQKSRPFVRIQDGCNNYCAYCIIPYLRGGLYSVPAKDIIQKVQDLSALGFYEVVLTGIHIGKYGFDISKKSRLSGLIQEILDKTAIGRIRLSSIEPDEIDEILINTIVNSNNKICSHLHIPMQSGSDQILKRMKRKYTTNQYTKVISDIRAKMPDICIGSDIITGFPGETDAEFNETRKFVSSLPISYLHIFTYSDRKGTEACEMRDKVEESIKKKRTNILREISTEKRRAYLKKNIDKKVMVVYDSHEGNICRKGVSENFINVLVEDDGGKRYEEVILKKIQKELMIGDRR